MNKKSRVADKQTDNFDLHNFPPFLLAKLNKHFQSVLEAALAPFDLIIPEWRALLCLNRRQNCTVNDIVEFTRLPQSTVSRTVAKLDRKGLLERSWCDEDNRVSTIRLSRKGHALTKDLYATVQQACSAEVERLIGEDTQVWIASMQKIADRLGPDSRY